MLIIYLIFLDYIFVTFLQLELVIYDVLQMVQNVIFYYGFIYVVTVIKYVLTLSVLSFV
jgi:hypothetical protein